MTGRIYSGMRRVMRAVVVEHPGADVVREIPDPSPGAGELLVRVVAAGVNPVDWKTRDAGQRKMPFVMGQDFAGLVVAVGANVRAYAIDERVFGIAGTHGSYAEYTIVPEDGAKQPVAGIPADVGDADAAALPTAGITALGSLDALGTKAGQTLVIVGVTGGVGGFAAQIAKSRDIHVIGVARSGQEHVAAALGVDEFIPYDTADPITAIAQSHPAGVDGYLDLANPAAKLDRAIDVIRKGGAVVSTIHAANEAHFATKEIRATNLYSLGTPAGSHAGLRELGRLVQTGVIRVRIAQEYPLSEVDRAIASSVAGTVTGKIVLTI